MENQPHFITLKKKHATLSDQIRSLERSPGADQTEIRRMKIEKLRIKDTLSRMK